MGTEQKKLVELGPDDIVISRSELREIQIHIREVLAREEKDLKFADRRISHLLGAIKPSPPLSTFPSVTGRKSKLADLRGKTGT